MTFHSRTNANYLGSPSISTSSKELHAVFVHQAILFLINIFESLEQPISFLFNGVILHYLDFLDGLSANYGLSSYMPDPLRMQVHLETLSAACRLCEVLALKRHLMETDVDYNLLFAYLSHWTSVTLMVSRGSFPTTLMSQEFVLRE